MTGLGRHDAQGIHPPGFTAYLARRTVRRRLMTDEAGTAPGPIDLPSAYSSFAAEIWAPRIAATACSRSSIRRLIRSAKDSRRCSR